jgi:hypothetical protein
MAYVEQKDVLNATTDGLDIILYLYPDALESVSKPNRKFKTRDEKTASAKLNRATDGSYLVIDFGGDGESKNAIQCYASENKCDFVTALRELATRYNVVSSEQAKDLIKATYSEVAAATTDEEGKWSYEVKTSLTDFEIETIVSKELLAGLGWNNTDPEKKQAAYNAIAGKFKYLHCHPLESYSIIKNRKVMTFTATDRYPIFLIDEETHQKIYQPLHPEKSLRFMYVPGKKPKEFIHGLVQLNAAYEENKKLLEEDEQNDEEDGGKKGKKKKVNYKLPEVILCTGFSDAINVALAGYRVIWLNSESAKLQQYHYDKISMMVEKFYQISDLDDTGKRMAHALAMQYLDIFNIELPAKLMTYRDRRGNPCKDVRDYFNFFKRRDFRTMLENDAMPYRFWDKKANYNKSGEYTGSDYEFRNEYAYNFLQKNGFYRLPIGDKETDFAYIQIEGNIVRFTSAVKIKAFVKTFLRSRQLDMKLRDAMHKTTQLNETSLTALDEIDVNFVDNDKSSQYLFFQNKTLEITAEGVVEHKPGAVKKYIWEDEVYPHRYEALDKEPFTITKDALGVYDITINNTECLFLKFLIQTSRVHWRTELEDRLRVSDMTPLERDLYLIDHQFDIAGPLLTEDEIEEQKRHLVNKIFSIGYMMHRYKDRSKGWFIFAMDGKLSEDGQSWGGSGKSIVYDMAMRALLRRNFMLSGRNPKLTDDPHKYDGLTEYHRYLFIDDAHKYLKLDVFYTDVTGDIKVNPKGKKPYTIPFEDAAKISFSSNYTPQMGPSTERRMIINVFSDYYHNAGETTDYLESRDPKAEFGKAMFTEFNPKEWNDFYSTAVYCLRFYLSTSEKITPGMGNVNKRNLTNIMGNNFHDWASAFFSEDGDKLDRFIMRDVAFKDFVHNVGGKWTPQSFLDRLKAFCKLNGYIFNPKVYQDKKGKIIKKVERKIYDAKTNIWTETGGAKETKEMIYIQTKDEAPEDSDIDRPESPEQGGSSDNITLFDTKPGPDDFPI